MATLSGGFRGVQTQNQLENVYDALSGAPGPSQRCLGGTLIDSLPLQPSLMAPWSINGWTIGFDLWVWQNVFAPIYGRLGNIYGGLAPNQQTIGVGGRPNVSPVLPFPPNSSLIAEVWDGEQSPSPPNGGNIPTPPARVSFTYPLPQPEVIQPGDQLSIGIWITPSVAANAQLIVLNASWSIVYDERSSPGIGG